MFAPDFTAGAAATPVVTAAAVDGADVIEGGGVAGEVGRFPAG